jgi:hypothetical protein
VIYSLVYVSSATALFLESELNDILATSRENNARSGISGMLLYKDGNLMQVLEGDESAVRVLYAKITADDRHHGHMVLWDGYASGRQFSDWSMAFRDLDRTDSVDTPGYSEFLNMPLTDSLFATNPTVSQRLLSTFRKSM